MIYAQPGETFEAELEAAPTALVGTIGVRVIDPPAGTTVIARQTAGITETPAGSGAYSVELVAPLEHGTYRILWDVVPGGAPLTPAQTFTEQLDVNATGAPVLPGVGISPTVADVAALIPSRTKLVNGTATAGTFTENTRPTDDQAESVIAQSARRVQMMLGPAPDEFIDDYKELVATLAALRIERTYYADQLGTPRSPHDALKKDFDEGLKALSLALKERGGGGEPGPGDDALMPLWTFDDLDGVSAAGAERPVSGLYADGW